jgi:hypothetical protein
MRLIGARKEVEAVSLLRDELARSHGTPAGVASVIDPTNVSRCS